MGEVARLPAPPSHIRPVGIDAAASSHPQQVAPKASPRRIEEIGPTPELSEDLMHDVVHLVDRAEPPGDAAHGRGEADMGERPGVAVPGPQICGELTVGSPAVDHRSLPSQRHRARMLCLAAQTARNDDARSLRRPS